MGGSSSKTTFVWKKKKKSPLEKAWSDLKGALPDKKSKKKSSRSLDKLNLDNLRKGKSSQRRFSLPTDKKEPKQRFSLGNMRKTPMKEEKERNAGGLGKVGEQMKRAFSQEQKKELRTRQDVSPSVKLKTKEKKEENVQKSFSKASKIKFKLPRDPFV